MELTHWKKLSNPNYLGAYAFQPGQDIIATIKYLQDEMVVGSDGKKEECSVIHFAETTIKPLIANATNCKQIAKLLKTPYIEQWSGQKIQLFVENVKAFGEVVEAVRVRPFLPKIVGDTFKCADCSSDVGCVGNMQPKQMAAYTQKKYGRILCEACATKAAQMNKPQDENKGEVTTNENN